MIRVKKISGLIALMSTLVILCPQEVKAFGPAAHFALINKVANDLPEESVIGQALKEYPNIAAWGANGPDLGYIQPAQLGGYAPWADRFHYFKVGSFAKEQLKEALNSGDLKKIAFAAGWTSHVTGDLACHGIYVNPECGVYLDNVSGRALHKELESIAEPYVWRNLGELPLNNYEDKKLGDRFSDVDEIPYGFLNSVSNVIYNDHPSTNEEKQWVTTMLAGINTGIGYIYKDYNDAISSLDENGRKERLVKAFSSAEKQCTNLLSLAENGDYSKFSDRWNLDVGASKSPISSLTAIITTGSKMLSGTDDDIYFGIELKTGEKKQWSLDKPLYNDFEKGDKDEYYLYINDIDFAPDLVKRVWVEKEGSSLAGNWYFQSLKVDVNGNIALSVNPRRWVKDSIPVYFDANWSNITNTSDPTF